MNTRVAFSLLIIILVGGCSSPPVRPPDGQALPACGWSPNCVNSESGEGVQAIDPIPASRGQWQQLKLWIGEQEDWQVTIDDTDFLQAVVKTPVLRFRDDLQLRFLPGDRLVHLRSSSRFGISDLGVNGRRAEMLRDLVATEFSD